jgi:hypothetical protein
MSCTERGTWNRCLMKRTKHRTGPRYNCGVNPQKIFCFAVLAELFSPALATYAQTDAAATKLAATYHARPHELAGFLLRQYRDAIESALGKPFAQEVRPSGNLACAYRLSGSKNNYFVAIYDQNKKSEMYSKAANLELTGADPSGFTGFFGLELGDPAEKVEKILGKPAEIRHEDDVNVDLWDYTQENYSVEISSDHKLYSIQIVDQPGKDTPDPAGSAAVLRFAQAIEVHDMETMMQMVSGEIECSTSDTFGIRSGAARTILTDQKSPISVCLKRAADAVLALGPDMKGADDQIRVWEKHSPGTVTKLPQSSPLAELVFDEEAGAWRVYEVTFREPAK